jgi:uncharacterized membrane protein (UPF0182 family)
MAKSHMVKRSVVLTVQLVVFVPLFVAFIFCAWTAWNRSNLPYNDMGRYFNDEQVAVYQEQTLEVYMFISVILFLAVAFLAGLIVKTVRFKPKVSGGTG